MRKRGMILLSNGRGVTLRTGWVDDDVASSSDPGEEDIKCPSCGAPLRRKGPSLAFCWFCEKEFELDASGSLIQEEEGDDDFEMDLDPSGDEEVENEIDTEEEPEEMEFDLEIDPEEEEFEMDDEDLVSGDEIEEDGDLDWDQDDDEFEVDLED